MMKGSSSHKKQANWLAYKKVTAYISRLVMNNMKLRWVVSWRTIMAIFALWARHFMKNWPIRALWRILDMSILSITIRRTDTFFQNVLQKISSVQSNISKRVVKALRIVFLHSISLLQSLLSLPACLTLLFFIISQQSILKNANVK